MPSSRPDHKFRASRYTTGAIVLHWTIALLVIAQIAGGYIMKDVLERGSSLQFDAFQLHKSLGITVLVLTIARIAWRLFNPPPPKPDAVPRREAVIAGIVHKTFYVLLIAVPLAGWLIVTVSPVQVATVLYFMPWLPWPHLPGFEGLSAASREGIEGLAEVVHVWLAYATGGLVLLHVAGALRHHLADGRYLARMNLFARSTGAREAYGHATATVITLAFVLAMIIGAAISRRAVTPGETVGAVPDYAPALRSAGPGDTADDTLAGAPSWTLVPQDSAVRFTVTYQNRDLTGTIAAFDADIRFAPDELAQSSIIANVDLASARIDGGAISQTQLTGPDGLAASADGTARFETDTITATDDGYRAQGTLTLRGTSVPVDLAFELAIEDDKATARGTAALDRLDFGVAEQSDPTGGMLAPTVEVSIELVATRS